MSFDELYIGNGSDFHVLPTEWKQWFAAIKQELEWLNDPRAEHIIDGIETMGCRLDNLTMIAESLNNHINSLYTQIDDLKYKLLDCNERL